MIEGHDTHPIDIERGMQNNYGEEPCKHNLQLEARSHVTVQKWIAEGGLDGRTATAQGICQMHKRFGELLPDELLIIEAPDTGEQISVVPGEVHVRRSFLRNRRPPL